MATTAGFTTDSIARWPLFLPVLLLCSAFIGGCAGSTGGGLKVIRILLLFKQGNRELKRLVHPNAVYSIKLGNRALPERILEAVWGFFSAYALVFIISMLAIIATGVDDFSAFASVVATLNNLGRAGGCCRQLCQYEPRSEVDPDCQYAVWSSGGLYSAGTFYTYLLA